MKIAVYTIALNEEQFVERWYESAKEADYLLIADTGSTDQTARVAQRLGINVVSIGVRPWRFDSARNSALSLLPLDVDICIALDMDEVLVEGWREKLEAIKPETTRPRYKYTWSWNGDQPGLQYGGDKIHRRQGYRWKHPVHEVLVADRIQEVQEWTDLEIHHHPDDSKSRGQYFPLLELAVQEQPWDDRNSYYLGREYCFNRMWDKAAVELKRYLSLPTAKWPAERAAAMRWLAKAVPTEAEDWLKKAVQEDPGRRESLTDLAMHYYGQGIWADCYTYSTKALSITEKPLDYLCEEFAWGSLPYDLAAIASYNLGDKKSARKYGTKAVELSPDDERLRRNLGFYQSK
jgi:glycosyltransferase involved in cell wall biosynthesis